MRTVDSSQWINRIQAFDFDMIVFSWGQSLSPGNEQKNWWGSDAANQVGSMNVVGVQDQVIDEIINKLIFKIHEWEIIYVTTIQKKNICELRPSRNC